VHVCALGCEHHWPARAREGVAFQPVDSGDPGTWHGECGGCMARRKLARAACGRSLIRTDGGAFTVERRRYARFE
jgi:hypothetical protein